MSENLMQFKFLSKLKPTQVMVFGFMTVILVGAILLNLPRASNDGNRIGFIEALFASTSAVCVTGFANVSSLDHWSLFGKVVIVFLFQIGGIGFMTIVSSIMIFLGKKITLRDRLIIQEALNLSSLHGMVKLIKNIILGTLLIEMVGAIILSLVFLQDYGIAQSVFMGIYHSVSSFCNAGFDIVGDSSLTPYVSHWVLNITIMFLITAGGLGFTVWIDLFKVFRAMFNLKNNTKTSDKNYDNRLSLHSKLVLIITGILIIFGALLFFIFEYSNTFAHLSLGDKILSSLFQSVSLRTTGFNTVNVVEMTYDSKFLTILLMFIGGSPGGTAGGVKTVTISIIIISIISFVKGNNNIAIFKKTIHTSLLLKCMSVVMLNLIVIFVSTMLLIISEKNIIEQFEFLDFLFEATSAVSTVGLSLGVISNLSPFGKIVICLCMFIGRLGPVTIALALSKKSSTRKHSINYPEAKVLIG